MQKRRRRSRGAVATVLSAVVVGPLPLPLLNAWAMELDNALEWCAVGAPAGVTITAPREGLGWQCWYEYGNSERVKGGKIWVWQPP